MALLPEDHPVLHFAHLNAVDAEAPSRPLDHPALLDAGDPRSIDDEEHLVHGLHAAGGTVRSIASVVGLSKSQVGRILAQMLGESDASAITR